MITSRYRATQNNLDAVFSFACRLEGNGERSAFNQHDCASETGPGSHRAGQVYILCARARIIRRSLSLSLSLPAVRLPLAFRPAAPRRAPQKEASGARRTTCENGGVGRRRNLVPRVLLSLQSGAGAPGSTHSFRRSRPLFCTRAPSVRSQVNSDLFAGKRTVRNDARG